MHNEPCQEKQKLTEELDFCLLRHRESVYIVMAAVGKGEEFDLAFSKNRQQFEALLRARMLLENHVEEHQCGLPQSRRNKGKGQQQSSEDRQ